MSPRIAIIAIVFLCATSALAEVRTLTLDEARAIGAERSFDVARAAEYRRKVAGYYVEQRADALPQLTLSASGLLAQDESQSAYGAVPRQRLGYAGANLTQPLFTWGKVGAAIRAAEVGLQTADEEDRLALQTVRREVTTTFYDILLARELERLAQENLKQRERHFDEAQRKLAAGVATDYDALAARVAVENARPETIRTSNGVAIARDRLRYILALAEPVDAIGELAVTVGKGEGYDEALRVALEHRPELKNLRLKLEVLREVVTITAADDKPRLDFKGNAGWRTLDLAYDDGTSDDGAGVAWDAGVYFSWPLFDGLRTRGKVAQAESEVNALRIEEARLREAIALEVRNACHSLNEAGEIVSALGGTVEQAERLLQMAEKGYEFGVKTRIEVDDAQLNLVQAQSNLARAQRDYLVAQAQLDWAMGVGE